MIEIIETNIKNTIKCERCQTKIRYDYIDIKEKERFISPWESYIFKYIICPMCGTAVEIKENAKNENNINK